jgi:hypothetical protein
MIHVVSFNAPQLPASTDVYAHPPYVNAQGAVQLMTVTQRGEPNDLPFALLAAGISHGGYPNEFGEFGTPEVGISQRFNVVVRRDAILDSARLGIIQFFRFMACDYYYSGRQAADGSLFAQTVPTAQRQIVATDHATGNALANAEGWYDPGVACFIEMSPRPVSAIPPIPFSFSDTPRVPVPLWLYNPHHNNAPNLLTHVWVKYDFTTVLALRQPGQPLMSICYFDWTIEWVYDFTPPANYLTAPATSRAPARTPGSAPGKQIGPIRPGPPPHGVLQPYFRSPGAALPPTHPSASRTNPILVDIR